MADAKSNPFGFDGLGDAGLDLNDFEPKTKIVDRDKIAATRAVASEAGFTTRRAVAPKAERPAPARPAPMPSPKPAPAPVTASKVSALTPAAGSAGKGRKRRVNIAELLGHQDRYPDSERAQLNMLAPVPIVMRWRAMVRDADMPAWEILEQAMDALEAKTPRGGKA